MHKSYAAPMNTLPFPTPLGTCALTWDEEGITGLQLLVAPAKKSTAKKAESPEAPAYVKDAASWVQKLLEGKDPGLFRGKLKWSQVTDFRRSVYKAAQKVPFGETCSYGELARELGLKPGASRAVGQALGANPWLLLVPCHRILSSNGKLTGFSAPGGVKTKAKLLEIEGSVLIAPI